MVKNLSLVPFWRWVLVVALLFALGVFILGALLRFWRAHRPPTRNILWTMGAFIAGIVVTAFGPSLVNSALSKVILPEHRWEAARLASPDGAVEAVMEGTGCGPVCADTYLVTVVPKGGKAPSDVERYAFSADDMVDAQLHWKQPHLLEIEYKRARINDFRNIVYPFARFGDQESWKYKVEIRLAPSSEGFSYLLGAGGLAYPFGLPRGQYPSRKTSSFAFLRGLAHPLGHNKIGRLADRPNRSSSLGKYKLNNRLALH